jgi:CHAT domain-containing protein
MELPVVSWRRRAARASRRLAHGRTSAAVKLYERAVRGAEREADPVLLAVLLHNLARAQIRAGRGLEAREILRRSRDLLRQSPGGREYLGTVLGELGSLEVELGELEAARQAQEEAIGVHTETGDRNGLARAEVDLGIALKDADRHTEARAHLALGLEIAREQGADKVVGHALTGLGLIHEQLNELELAETSYQEALSAYERAGDEANVSTIHYNLGSILDRQGELTRAVHHYRSSYEIDKARGDIPGITAAMSAIASVALELGDTERAEVMHRTALRLQHANGNRPQIVSTLIDTAIIARDRREWQEAESLFAEAAQLAEQSADANALYEIHLNWGDLGTLSGDPSTALAHYAKAVAAIQSARGRLLREEEVLAYFDDGRLAALDRLVVLSAERAEIRACLHWVEYAKGRELARRMATVPLPPPRDTPAELAQQESYAAQTVRTLSAELAEDVKVTPALVQRLTHAERELRAVWAQIAPYDPEFTALRDDTPPTSEEMARTAAKATAQDGRAVLIVQYYVCEDTILVLGVTADREPTMVAVPCSAAQAEELATGLFPVDGLLPSPGADRGAWQEFMGPLVDPIRAWSRPGDVVYLCPHDVLHRVPLHAVNLDGTPLGERNIVAYTPSVSVLRSCLARRAQSGRRAVVLGDADGREVFVRDEALAVADVLRAQGIETDLGVGARATGLMLTRALAEEPGPDFVHVAAHGSFDRSSPMGSGIALADGFLTAAQVMTLPLSSRLVALSACESGLTARRSGDELIGLSRALMYAGTPSVLVSMWQVGQISTNLLMQAFYRELIAGAPKGVALWRAQCELRKVTVRDLLEYFAQARDRSGDDATARTAVDLASAAARIEIGDVSTARDICADVAARAELTKAQRKQVDRLRSWLSHTAESGPTEPDYERRPFDGIGYWAPFVLIGDWR